MVLGHRTRHLGSVERLDPLMYQVVKASACMPAIAYMLMCTQRHTLSTFQTVCKLIRNYYLSHLHWIATRHIPGPAKGSGLVRGMRHHVTSQLISRRAFLNTHKASQTKQHLTKCPPPPPPPRYLKPRAKYSGPSGYTKRATWHSYLSHSPHKILWVPTVCTRHLCLYPRHLASAGKKKKQKNPPKEWKVVSVMKESEWK